MKLRGRSFGLALALFGVFTVTPDAMLVRYASSGGGSPALILCVKSAFTAIVAAAIVLAQHKCDDAALSKGLRAAPKHLAVVLLMQVIINVGFPMAFLYTTAAKALLIISLNPLWAAVFSRILLKDKLAPATMIALVLSIACVLVVFVPPIIIGSGGAATQNTTDPDATAVHAPTIAGDLISIGTGVALGAFLTASRWTATRKPDAGLSLTTPLANAVIALGFLPIAIVDAVRDGVPGPLFWGTLAADGVCLSIALVCVVTAPKHAKSAEVALVLLVENLIGPLWVFLGFGEVPSVWTFVGGSLLLLTLGAHEAYMLKVQSSRVVHSSCHGLEAWTERPPSPAKEELEEEPFSSP